MPAKWQQWMPFRIDAFKSSPAVQAMHPAARAGYLYLLSCAWQTDDCTIPDDDLTLSEMSGLGDELWPIHSVRILRKFSSDGRGKLQNSILFEEWKEAKRVFDSRRLAADRTNKDRWANGDRTVTDKGASRSAYTRTGTETVTVKLNTPPNPPKGARRRTKFEPGLNGQPTPKSEAENYADWVTLSDFNKQRFPWKGITPT